MSKLTQDKSAAEEKPAPKDQTQRPIPKDKGTLLSAVLAFVMAKAV
jgi:hypothetical protein